MYLWLEAGGAFDIREVPRRRPGPDEIEIAVQAASFNPIDVRRTAGYGRRLLSLMGASRFPMALGNDFTGVVAAVGSGASGFTP
jgi:reticulon-4-interacting protein 1, mitochondrial